MLNIADQDVHQNLPEENTHRKKKDFKKGLTFSQMLGEGPKLTSDAPQINIEPSQKEIQKNRILSTSKQGSQIDRKNVFMRKITMKLDKMERKSPTKSKKGDQNHPLPELQPQNNDRNFLKLNFNLIDYVTFWLPDSLYNSPKKRIFKKVKNRFITKNQFPLFPLIFYFCKQERL